MNITDRRQAERFVRQSEEQYRLLAESIPQLVWMNRPDGTSEYNNQRWVEYTGWTQERTAAEDWAELVHPEDLPHLRTMWTTALQTGQPYEFECRLRRADGVFRWFIARALPLRNQQGQLLRWIGTCTDIDDHKRTEAERDILLQRLQVQIERMPLALLLIGPDHRVLDWNPAAERMFDYTREEALGRSVFELIVPASARKQTEPIFHRLLTGDMSAHSRNENVTKNGRILLCDWFNTPLLTPEGTVDSILSMALDVTERVRLEEQVRQSQKMEAIGQLAGGVAHDFNNLLTIINGYSELLQNSFPANDTRSNLLTQIRKAGERATTLTRQLLTFSRKEAVTQVVLDPNEIIAHLEKMLRRVLGEDIDFQTTLQKEAGYIKADAGQVEQVIMNLAVNARDAMPQGGRLIVQTSSLVVDGQADQMQSPADIRPGSYVVLTVADTGHGMDAATQARIFEPFFTTKEIGKGTGLGLSTVYGIVKQSGGHITVDSEPGKGTTFRIFFPRIDQMPRTRNSDPGPLKLSQGKETILLVEDEEDVRGYTRHVLEEAGYRVIEARSGPDALRASDQHREPIHLLLTDVVMPHMSGPQLVDVVVKRRRNVKVLYLSGYTNDAMVRHGIQESGIAFLHKPFTPAALAQKVREVLTT